MNGTTTMPLTIRQLQHRLRQALADYIASEGCSCCQNDVAHHAAEDRLAALLHVPRYGDDSGYAWPTYQTRRRIRRKLNGLG